MFCTSLGTDGLQDLMSAIQDKDNYVGQIKTMFRLYSRFRPQRRDPGTRIAWRHPAIDIPGSRTYRDPDSPSPLLPSDVVSETINVDAQDLFSQLSTLAYLGKREPRQGLLYSIQEVSEGTMRVWRDWLSRQCESKKWTDGEPIAVHHDGPINSRARADSVTDRVDPAKDPAILWLNTRDDNLGIKLRVRERKLRKNNMPVLYSSDIDLPVSYQVEFEGETEQAHMCRLVC